MRTRYYRKADQSRKYSLSRDDIIAIGDDRTADPNSRPFAHIVHTIDRAKFIPTINGPEPTTAYRDDNKHWLASLSKELGVHPDYANHVFNQQWDPDEDDYSSPIADLMRDAQDMSYWDHNDKEKFGIPPENKRDFKHAVNKLRNTPEFNPETLFVDKPTQVTVSELFADPSMKTHAMTLGAMAMNNESVAKVTPSHDLSAHSSRLVESAKRFGLIDDNEANPDAEVTNSIRSRPMRIGDGDLTDLGNGQISIPAFSGTYNEVPESEVFRAQQTMRKIVRGGKSKRSPKMSNQFDVPLPGMENF